VRRFKGVYDQSTSKYQQKKAEADEGKVVCMRSTLLALMNP
jgi:hypothetical protein